MVKQDKAVKNAKKGDLVSIKKQGSPVKAKTPLKAKGKVQNAGGKNKNVTKVKILGNKKPDGDDDDDDEEVEESGADYDGDVLEKLNSEEDEDNTNSEDEENIQGSDENDLEGDEDELEDSESDDENDDDEQNGNSDDDAPTEVSSKNGNKSKVLSLEEKKERSIFVKNMHENTNLEQVNKLFSECGEIEFCRFKKFKSGQDAHILFKDAEASKEALKFHNTIFNDKTILVDHSSIQRPKSNVKCTVVLLNSEGLPKLEGSRVSNIFSKCGKIIDLCVVCQKRILAYITFKDPDAVSKALALNGTTQDGIKIDVQPFKSSQHTKVFVKNIEKGVTEGELTEMFKVAGPVAKVVMQRNPHGASAVVTFEDSDAYCKAFLLHGEVLHGQPIGLVPYEKIVQRNPGNNNFGGKRSAPNMWKSGPPSKFQRFDKSGPPAKFQRFDKSGPPRQNQNFNRSGPFQKFNRSGPPPKFQKS